MKGILFPRINRADVGFIVKYSILGAFLAGFYGIIHDQFTFTISSEYFTQIKFKQFHYADFGMGNRAFVCSIGFLATWWVGLFAGWILSRSVLSANDKTVGAKKVKLGFCIIFGTAVITAVLVGLYTQATTNFYDHASWAATFDYYNIKNFREFMQVVYIHYASYFGGLVGLVIAVLVLLMRNKIAK